MIPRQRPDFDHENTDDENDIGDSSYIEHVFGGGGAPTPIGQELRELEHIEQEQERRRPEGYVRVKLANVAIRVSDTLTRVSISREDGSQEFPARFNALTFDIPLVESNKDRLKEKLGAKFNIHETDFERVEITFGN